ncbi:hypothetical protein A3A64_04295 [Candidatus Gottesmanbacteria bacterium RIFCSPLOWO2_01_FULL_48_11]|uniref:RCK N-terminal domain-containing protein n=1 Tax=Candidatus Gottesmanbacteria bacterium RIFCSPLOWO2_01_FULL_48_11 TaxID=1798395 RepID=A0A1F6ATN1_9BACT|nr:MAG: hypothetical protein A3A64_04295 [Candidatus Gottesmanbacteria bacterium RIFCSPLOWO2_01_FULL_48_11]
MLVGVHRTGSSILKALSNSGEDFVALDFDPLIVKDLQQKEIPVVYGDVADEEIQNLVGLRKARLIISTVPGKRDNMTILEARGKAKVIVTAGSDEDAKEFYKRGANYVIMPQFSGGWELAQAISTSKGLSGLVELQERDAQVLDLRGVSHRKTPKKSA